MTRQLKALPLLGSLGLSACVSGAPIDREDLAQFLAREYALENFARASADLNDDGQMEHLVLAEQSSWCGTGGCTMFILQEVGTSYALVSKTTIVNTPVKVLESRTNGWRDLEVRVRYDASTSWPAKLSFDGETYPANPSVAPAVRMENSAAGRVVF